MKSRYIAVSLVAGLLVILTQYTNCAPAEVDFATQSANSAGENPVQPVDAPPPTIEDIAVLCASGGNSTQTVQVNFPDPQVTCPWNTNGNLAPRDVYFQGRIEQNMDFSLPAGSTLCSLQLDFAVQQFQFDDHFILVFDDIVIASSYRFTSFDQMSGLSVYNWSKIAGMYWNHSDEGTFCAGKDSMCSWPATDVPGSISMKFTPAFVQSIFALNPNRTAHQFKMVTIGDNDNLDCAHSPIQFSVKLKHEK